MPKDPPQDVRAVGCLVPEDPPLDVRAVGWKCLGFQREVFSLEWETGGDELAQGEYML